MDLAPLVSKRLSYRPLFRLSTAPKVAGLTAEPRPKGLQPIAPEKG
jgi:hypothetical protein